MYRTRSVLIAKIQTDIFVQLTRTEDKWLRTRTKELDSYLGVMAAICTVTKRNSTNEET